MPQAKLPDINAAWVRYKNYALECIDKKNYPGAVAAVNGINAMLPENYRVKIDTDNYKELTQDNIFVVCTDCEKRFKYDDIRIMNLIIPRIFNKPSVTERVWICTSCNFHNKVANTKMIKQVHEKPFYYKVIPEAPEQMDGILNRKKYHNEMTKWLYNSLEELDHQLGKYREEYKPIDELDETGYFVGEEENDED